jgi:hypothetical protein
MAGGYESFLKCKFLLEISDSTGTIELLLIETQIAHGTQINSRDFESLTGFSLCL